MAETLTAFLKQKRKKETKQASGFWRRLKSSDQKRALVLENVCGVAKRGIPGWGSAPPCSNDGWGACQKLLPMSQEKIFATDLSGLFDKDKQFKIS